MKEIKIISRLFILILMIFIAGQGLLFSTIRATYEPVPYLRFKLGNKIVVPPSTPLGTFSSANLVAHIGTIKITRDNDTTDRYYRPLMINYSSTASLYVDGKLTVNWSDTRTEFRYYFHNSLLTQPYAADLAGDRPLFAWDTETVITPNPYYVQIFIVSQHPSSYYIEGEEYQIVSGTLGSFNIKVMKKTPYQVEEFISVNGQEMPPGGGPPISDPVPLPIGGPGVLPPEIPFGEEPPPLNFIFSFQNDTVNFDLSEAYNNKKTINVAQMDVQNGVAGTTYKQNLTFTDSGSAQSFQLKADGVSGNTIGFNLYFGNSPDPIPYGQAFEWTGLVPNMNYKDLKIGGILESEVNQRVSGSYFDTITVNITAADN